MLQSLQDAGLFGLGVARLAVRTVWMIGSLLLSRVSAPAYQRLESRMMDIMKDTPLLPSDYVNSVFSMAYVRMFVYADPCLCCPPWRLAAPWC
ncbi:hypothetical protein ACOMHN_044196 [Nucella lapillus]